MDINDLRGLATVFAMAAFIGVAIWAYSSKQKARFDEAANLPFADEDEDVLNNDKKERAASAERPKEKSDNE
ncbi:cbb3-type cytochrome c oxidase subunit 3 [Salinispirillum sp. LH 10-3-1]|uniref:Cbb3-type cytochrome c oxidase subunit 3 n=1 Tax=Salinispirillum sp. LH 10-3-1 TaxID=2952525 RepID=A0AB38YKL8_9GAMM